MDKKQSIVVNGDLGSGKSTVSVQVAARLGLRRISVGDLYREMAQQRGLTALQLNLHAQLDDAVDGYVDELQESIARSGEQLVVDSRLAWHFFREAFKVHLITDPVIAAQRAMMRPSSDVEEYVSLDIALRELRERSESERMRFITRYGVDKARLRNYNLVCDTTNLTPDMVTDNVIETFEASSQGRLSLTEAPLLMLYPKRVYPTQDMSSFTTDEPTDGSISVGYADSTFYVVDGHRRLSEAVRTGQPFITAELHAEADELVVGGVSAAKFVESEVTPARIHEWEQAHGIQLPVPQHLAPPQTASTPS